MATDSRALWARFTKYSYQFPSIGLSVDLSRMQFTDDFLAKMKPPMVEAFRAMAALEGGAISNPDEHRMVGHYWLRNPALAPNPELRQQIEQTLRDIDEFAESVHSGEIKSPNGEFTNLLVIGIGGSALGPQFVASALTHPGVDRLRVHFFDNTDPDGMDRVLASIGANLSRTLCIVISKSGGTKETRNGMVEAAQAFEKAGLRFAAQAVAITGRDSELDKTAVAQGWLRRFPMWDWVGGRTSETSAVGLLPARLQGFDIHRLLEGARACDEATRIADVDRNPAAQLALMWYHAGGGRGLKDMVIIPYKDRLELFSRYLQQLVMESLGKELDLQKKAVNQGIAVYGNKGSTDQHAYVQQLRDGINNFFVTFIRVLKDREKPTLYVEPNVTSGDYLDGFLFGTRQALYEKGRESVTLTINDVSPFSVGVLIALYERAVGLYAFLVGINAYHQPGVEAGKKAAGNILRTQEAVISFLSKHRDQSFTAEEIAAGIGAADEAESVYHILEHLSFNPDRGIKLGSAQRVTEVRFQAV